MVNTFIKTESFDHMNKIEWHTLVSIPTQILEEVHQMYKLIEMNKWEQNEQKLNIVSMYVEHVWEIVSWVLHKHYLSHWTNDVLK